MVAAETMKKSLELINLFLTCCGKRKVRAGVPADSEDEQARAGEAGRAHQPRPAPRKPEAQCLSRVGQDWCP